MLLLLHSAFLEAAEPVCYRWFSNESGGGVSGSYFPSQASLAGAMMAYKNANPQTGGSGTGAYRYQYNAYSCDTAAPTGTSGSRSCTYSAVRIPHLGGACSGSGGTVNCTTVYSINFTTQYNVDPAGCPPDPCENAAELAQPGVAVGARVEQSGTMCSSDDGSGGAYSGGTNGTGCVVVRDGAGIASSDSQHWYGQIKYTGVSCPASPTPQVLDSDSNCFTATGGGTVCVSKTGKNCGTVNGQRVCYADVPENSCTLLSGGGAICEEGAETGPKDDMDEPLEPDITLTETTDGTTRTLSYYTRETIITSVTQVSGSGAGDSESEDGEGCTEEDCTGSLPAAFEELDSFQQITQGFMDRVSNAGVIEAVSSVGAAMPAGSCPNWTFEVFDREISLSAPVCSIFDSISGMLAAVMLVAWGLLAARIVLSA